MSKTADQITVTILPADPKLSNWPYAWDDNKLPRFITWQYPNRPHSGDWKSLHFSPGSYQRKYLSRGKYG